MPSRHCHVAMPQLPRYVAELNAGREQLAGEGVAEILRGSVADLGSLADLLEVPAPGGWYDWESKSVLEGS